MDYIYHIGVMVSLYVILATSFNLLIGCAGLFALSHAGFYALGAYTVAILATSFDLPFPVPLLIGAVGTAVVGATIAMPALRIGGHYLVVITMAFQVILLAVLLNLRSLTGGTDGISGIPQIELFGIQLIENWQYMIATAIVAALCYWICAMVANSPFGRALRAMRENEQAAESVGKNIVYMKVMVFMVSSGLAAVAGGMYARYVTFVAVDSFTISETIYILGMVILGGTGNLRGSVLGGAILVILPELLKFLDIPPDIADKLRHVIYGALLIIVLRVRPQGLLPELQTDFRPKLAGGEAAPATSAAEVPVMAAAVPATVRGKDLTKNFGGIVGVRNLNIELKPGTITGLIGPNGAGKTTAFNLLTGFLKPTSGSVVFRDQEISNLKPNRIVKSGMARSFQDLKLFTKMSVLENVLVALPNQRGDNILSVFMSAGRFSADDAENCAKALEILDFIGLHDKAEVLAENLSYAEEKLLVIARLLATGAEVLLFDEPLSGLDPTTLAEVLPTIRKLAEQGKTICIIEHNLDVIKNLCDWVVFLDEGRDFAEGKPEDVMADPVLAERYFA